jgi:hypothetical protein
MGKFEINEKEELSFDLHIDKGKVNLNGKN